MAEVLPAYIGPTIVFSFPVIEILKGDRLEDRVTHS